MLCKAGLEDMRIKTTQAGVGIFLNKLWAEIDMLSFSDLGLIFLVILNTTDEWVRGQGTTVEITDS
jgi:hypothetical protein